MMKHFFVLLLMPIFGVCQNHHMQELSDYMDRQAAVNGFNGNVIVMKQDRVLLKKAYGLANREWNVPNTLDTKFVLASVSKYFTAIAVMQLVEQRMLSVDDKLSEFFPDYPDGDKVTIHMLLTHTSGLALDFDELYMNSTTVTRDSAVVAVGRKPFVFEPGTSCKYSNIGYFLLAQIIEKASGHSYANQLQKAIFGPAGMHDSGVCSNDSVVSKKANIYYKENGSYFKNPYINWNLNVGHDGLYSTIDDLYKLDRAIKNNAIISAQTRALMETRYNAKYPDNGFFDSYGYGIFIDPYYSHGHALRTHSGGFIGVMTTFDRYPDDDVFIAVLSNSASESHIVSYGLSAILFGIPVEMPYVPKQVDTDPKKIPAFAGDYGDVKIMASNGKLYLKSLDTELLPESPSRFFRKDNPDRKFEFEVDKKGKVLAVFAIKGGVKERKARSKNRNDKKNPNR